MRDDLDGEAGGLGQEVDHGLVKGDASAEGDGSAEAELLGECGDASGQ